MEAIEFVHVQFANVRRLCDSTLEGITEDQLNWAPPGTCNPISSTYIHMLTGEDFFIQTVLQKYPTLWDRDGWAAKMGLKETPSPRGGWDDIRQKRITLAPVQEYARAVFDATDVYLHNLDAECLDREVDFMGRSMPVSDILAMLMAHIAGHAGEISALKGSQGAKGMPY
jgi:hypothetical protein